MAEGTRLDPWFDFYSERTQHMKASAIRALFAVANRPEVVSLAGGMPFLDGLPLEHVAETTSRIIREHGMVALQYGSGQGLPELREQILEVMAHEAITAHSDDIVVTTGSQQALDLVTRIFIDPGDVIIAEAPSYVGALGVFHAAQGEVVHVPMDDDGLVPEALDETLTHLLAQGRRVKFIYTVPNFHNPGGMTLSLERRPRIVEIAKKHGVLILEDNPYGLLGFDSDPLPALHSFAPEHVIYLGSFSKTFSPGFRVGWALAPHAVREKLVIASEASILCPSMLAQMSISSYLESWDWLGQVKKFREVYRERRDAMIGALEEYLPQATWTEPQGGFYTWVTLPEGLDAQTMLPRAVTELVAYVPGTAFFADGGGRSNMRLSFCYPPPERIAEGVRRLSRVVQKEQELVHMFGVEGISNVDGTHGPGPDVN